MSSLLKGNSEAGFLSTTLTEFIHLWRSKKEASLSLECKNGQTFVNFRCSLGHPDSPHIQDGRRKRRHRVKSDTRRSRDNARAAAHQAARASLQPAASPSRTASSPAPQPPPHRTVTSPPPSSPDPARPDTSPAETEMLQVTSSPLSSPREEPENASQIITDLELWRQVQLCSVGPPHRCEEFYRTATEDELEVLERWNTLSKEQAGGTRRRPDLKQFLSEEPSEEEGFYPPSIWCSALQRIRPETLRSEPL